MKYLVDSTLSQISKTPSGIGIAYEFQQKDRSIIHHQIVHVILREFPLGRGICNLRLYKRERKDCQDIRNILVCTKNDTYSSSSALISNQPTYGCVSELHTYDRCVNCDNNPLFSMRFSQNQL